jgi:hypothetical protein
MMIYAVISCDSIYLADLVKHCTVVVNSLCQSLLLHSVHGIDFGIHGVDVCVDNGVIWCGAYVERNVVRR